MQEAKAPNFSIKEASLTHYSHNLMIELCILQHPKNLTRSEDISIEDIAFFDVV